MVTYRLVAIKTLVDQTSKQCIIFFPFVAFTFRHQIRHKNIALNVHMNALGQITQTTEKFVGEKWHIFSLNGIIVLLWSTFSWISECSEEALG